MPRFRRASTTPLTRCTRPPVRLSRYCGSREQRQSPIQSVSASIGRLVASMEQSHLHFDRVAGLERVDALVLERLLHRLIVELLQQRRRTVDRKRVAPLVTHKDTPPSPLRPRTHRLVGILSLVRFLPPSSTAADATAAASDEKSARCAARSDGRGAAPVRREAPLTNPLTAAASMSVRSLAHSCGGGGLRCPAGERKLRGEWLAGRYRADTGDNSVGSVTIPV